MSISINLERRPIFARQGAEDRLKLIAHLDAPQLAFGFLANLLGFSDGEIDQ
jgi:hypothetical protein